MLLRGCASQVGDRNRGLLWKPEGIISVSGLTLCMFAHANLTVAFQVQISRENKEESRNWSTCCIELSCSCNIHPEAVSGSSFPHAEVHPAPCFFVLHHLFLACAEEAHVTLRQPPTLNRHFCSAELTYNLVECV